MRTFGFLASAGIALVASLIFLSKGDNLAASVCVALAAVFSLCVADT
jgi:hypothetical protein